jgi:uncharacterized protein (TIGR03435 family)
MKAMLLLLALFLARAPVCAQEFEAAVVKVHPPSNLAERSGIEDTPGLIRFENLSLKAYIEIANGVKDYQFSGPDWLNGVRFDITARPPAGYQRGQFPALLERLLADRFQLAVHREPREVAGYTLQVARSGLKLPEAAGARGYFTVRPGLISGTQVAMHELVGALAGRLGRPVVDGTGLTAKYDVKLEWTPDAEASSAEFGISLFTALQAQLGLQLSARKVTLEVVIVDRVQKTPTEN